MSMEMLPYALLFTMLFISAGACSDQKFRFWDLATNLIICSCPYYEERRQNSRGDKSESRSRPASQGPTNYDEDVDTEEILKHLLLGNEDDNTLIGGYDNGIIRGI